MKRRKDYPWAFKMHYIRGTVSFTHAITCRVFHRMLVSRDKYGYYFDDAVALVEFLNSRS